MLKIRLRRVGAKKQPSYRIVVAKSESPRDGRFVEKIGFYNPRTEPHTVDFDEERALYWLSQGAQPTQAVARFFEKAGTLERLTRLKGGEDMQILLQEAVESRPVAVETPVPMEQDEAELELAEEIAEGADTTPESAEDV
jgi:small subunit ribosomal protein S16